MGVLQFCTYSDDLQYSTQCVTAILLYEIIIRLKCIEISVGREYPFVGVVDPLSQSVSIKARTDHCGASGVGIPRQAIVCSPETCRATRWHAGDPST
jgi:hypothetical protein